MKLLLLLVLSFHFTACLRCEEKPLPPPRPAEQPASDPAGSCEAFIDFNFRCGIGRPPADPTVDAVTRRNNELVIRGELVRQCQEKRPPFDQRVLQCFLDAKDDCALYNRCRIGVIGGQK